MILCANAAGGCGKGVCTALACILSMAWVLVPARGRGAALPPLTGRDIVARAVIRHAGFPYVYEEQTMVLVDDAGNKNVRKLRRYLRIEADKTVRILMVFDYPREMRGLTLYAMLPPDGQPVNQVYLPAMGAVRDLGARGDSLFLGTDFSVRDLWEPLDRTRYRRLPDQTMEKVAYFVVDAFDADTSDATVASGVPALPDNRVPFRRLFVRKDIFFIVRTDYFDGSGRLIRRFSRHEIRQTDRDLWTANMLLMENHRQGHTSLIKVDQRILSSELVGPDLFTLPGCRGKSTVEENNPGSGSVAAPPEK